MELYNSLTQVISPFVPLGSTVTIYVCGITPYDTTHLGHAFTYVANDILIRYLEYQGYKVTYVQNVTDIDDDILRKAREVGEDWRQLGNRWTRHFIDDLIALNVRPPEFYPRASDVVPDMHDLIERLMSAGMAYESAGNVYYHVDRWESFGKLSKLPREAMLPVANERGNFPDDPHKQAPLDFVLWQAAKEGEPAWASPWGMGRPGWHIECSALVRHFLGDTIDIHSGGADLLFPHHECEIAQMEPVTGREPFVRYWLHTAMVRHEGEKMSKSLGNLIMIRDLLQEWPADTLRLYLAMHNYRKPWSHNEQELQSAHMTAGLLAQAVQVEGGEGFPVLDAAHFESEFQSVMNDDLGTPQAIFILNELAKAIMNAAGAGHKVVQAQEILRRLGGILGLTMGSQPFDPNQHKSGWLAHRKRFED